MHLMPALRSLDTVIFYFVWYSSLEVDSVLLALALSLLNAVYESSKFHNAKETAPSHELTLIILYHLPVISCTLCRKSW